MIAACCNQGKCSSVGPNTITSSGLAACDIDVTWNFGDNCSGGSNAITNSSTVGEPQAFFGPAMNIDRLFINQKRY